MPIKDNLWQNPSDTWTIRKLREGKLGSIHDTTKPLSHLLLLFFLNTLRMSLCFFFILYLYTSLYPFAFFSWKSTLLISNIRATNSEGQKSFVAVILRVVKVLGELRGCAPRSPFTLLLSLSLSPLPSSASLERRIIRAIHLNFPPLSPSPVYRPAAIGDFH